MTDISNYTFVQIKKRAEHFGSQLVRFKSISSRMGSVGEQLQGIAKALDVIASTPNASINEEGLRGFEKRVEAGIEAFKEWLKETLNPDDDEDCEMNDDETPF